MNSAALKERHYAHLASKLQTMSRNLAESQQQFADVTRQVEHMTKLGALHASQFMAVSRLLDTEADEEQAAGKGQGDASAAR